jgi:hypothetical protein
MSRARQVQPEHLRGTRLGVETQVSPGWSEYRGEIERRPEEVHYDVLRREGFSRDRAREIARQSADRQGYLLDEHRAEQGIPTEGSRYEGGLRRKTPVFGEHAGKLCRVLPDGTLVPVEGA